MASKNIMSKHLLKKRLLIICFLLFTIKLFSQSSTVSPVRQTIAKIDTFYKSASVEKLFLQLDKPYYTAGDTILFKAYLFDQQSLMPSTKSGLFYIDIYQDSSNIIKQISLPLAQGISWGEIAIPETLKSGAYQLRAYTNWMRNFSEELFFYQSIYIANPSSKDLLINLTKQDSSGSLKLGLQFSKLNQTKLSYQPLHLSILAGDKTLIKNEVKTDRGGNVIVDFRLPPNINTNEFLLLAEDKQNNHTIPIPFTLNRPTKLDLQFFPESGAMVDGIPSRIGFKAIGEDGRSVSVKGKIINSKQEIITDFSSLHKGMGIFTFLPQTGEQYIALLQSPVGITTQFKLPQVRKSGIVMQLDQDLKNDSILITFNSSNDLINNAQYILVGQSRNIVCYGRMLTLDKGRIQFKVASNLFPTGVARFSLFSMKQQLLNERIIFINHQDALRFNIPTDTAYATNDSIRLQLKVVDHNGNPVRGNYSIAITDDSQVQIDSNAKTIMTELLLGSDIKGYIEEPGYYFTTSTYNTAKALDCLLLTQGWTGFNWATTLTGNFKPAFTAEKTFTINGKVTTAFDKPIDRSKVVLLSTGKYQFLKDTLTDENGNFTFDRFTGFDSTAFVLQARNARGRIFNVGIAINTSVLPPIKRNQYPKALPWYLHDQSLPYSADIQKTIAVQLVTNDFRYTQGDDFLPDVVVSSKRVIRGSQNLNGPGEADLIIGMQELDKMGKKTLLQVLKEKIKGFREDITMRFRINRASILFVVDGQPLSRFYLAHELRSFLEYCTAENIKGIELMTSMRYTAKYSIATGGFPSATDDIAYIEITTHAGLGPFFKETPGFYLHKPLPYYWPKDYYRPRFIVKEGSYNIDRYVTIYWLPNLMIGDNGISEIQFYSGSRSGTYTLIVQGTDYNGRLGIIRKVIRIK